MHENGEGFPQSNEKALKYYERACSMKSAIGCYTLGTVYELGKLVPQDKSVAARYFKKACNLEDKESCRTLNQYLDLEIEAMVEASNERGKRIEEAMDALDEALESLDKLRL